MGGLGPPRSTPWPPGRSAGSSPARGPRRPRAGGRHKAWRHDEPGDARRSVKKGPRGGYRVGAARSVGAWHGARWRAGSPRKRHDRILGGLTCSHPEPLRGGRAPAAGNRQGNLDGSTRRGPAGPEGRTHVYYRNPEVGPNSLFLFLCRSHWKGRSWTDRRLLEPCRDPGADRHARGVERHPRTPEHRRDRVRRFPDWSVRGPWGNAKAGSVDRGSARIWRFASMSSASARTSAWSASAGRLASASMMRAASAKWRTNAAGSFASIDARRWSASSFSMSVTSGWTQQTPRGRFSVYASSLPRRSSSSWTSEPRSRSTNGVTRASPTSSRTNGRIQPARAVGSACG